MTSKCVSVQIGDFPKAVEVVEEAFDNKYYLCHSTRLETNSNLTTLQNFT